MLFLYLCLLLQATHLAAVNHVEHKNLQLNLYLDLIKYNVQEKLGILPYILANPRGVYLEVGTGGDPIAKLLANIPDKASPTIIASDIDENILKLLPTRHPQLSKYLTPNKSGPVLKLQKLDATNMSCFSDNYLSGINASAVVHEIVSYAGGVAALDKFFVESLRVLTPGGVLVYRDPEAVEKRDELVNVNFKTPSIRLFAHIFLVKFLDDKYSKLAVAKRKNRSYDIEKITFTIYKKNEILPCKLSYKEYQEVCSYEIDFSRQYAICLPRGLCREIERHYLTYLHQCNPLVFVKLLPTIDSNAYFVNYLAHSTSTILEEFLAKNGLSITNGTLDIGAKRILDQRISSTTSPIEYGVLLHFSSKHKERILHNLLKCNGFEPSVYIIQVKEGESLIDYRILGLLFDYIEEKVFDEHNGPINKDDIVHARWLLREGEETYVYYSDDELISRVAQASLSTGNNIDSSSFVLCPLSAAHNKFIPRLCYDEVLRDSLDINDTLGYPIEIKEGKRIIHFGKMSLENAMAIYEDIIKTNPQHYERLQQFVNSCCVNKILVSPNKV